MLTTEKKIIKIFGNKNYRSFKKNLLEARKKKTVPKNAGTTVGQTYTPANFPFKTAKIKCSIDERMLPGGEISKRMGLDTFLPMDAAVVESDAELYRIVDEIEYKAIIKTKKVIGTKGLAKLPKGAVTPDSESEFGASFAGELAAALEFGRQHAKRFKAPLYIIRVPNCKGCLCATSDMGDTLGGRTGKFYKEMKKFKIPYDAMGGLTSKSKKALESKGKITFDIHPQTFHPAFGGSFEIDMKKTPTEIYQLIGNIAKPAALQMKRIL